MQPRLLRSPARLAGASLLRLQSDDRLVSLARDGHEQAFAAIVERYRDALVRYAGRIAGAERGEDAVQQAFVSAHRALVRDPDRSVELRPWLYRIVPNASLNQLRGARDEAPLDEAAFAALPDDAIERREQLREALDAVAAPPPTPPPPPRPPPRARGRRPRPRAPPPPAGRDRARRPPVPLPRPRRAARR